MGYAPVMAMVAAAGRAQDRAGTVPCVAVVIPCYGIGWPILELISRIGREVHQIYIVDDACTQKTGLYVQQFCSDPRVTVLFNQRNKGVGGATLLGYRQALHNGAELIVKIDGDGQMDPGLIMRVAQPVLEGLADYAKGNRFFHLHHLRQMPWIRLVGNGALSLLSKISTGYWDLFDPTNGFTCIHGRVAANLPFKKLSQRYFFESDVLFRLSLMRAVVMDVPMAARYGREKSGIKLYRVIPEFFFKHLCNSVKRLFYNYLWPHFSMATLGFLVGLPLLATGGLGALGFFQSIEPEPVGQRDVSICLLSVGIGAQMIALALKHDFHNVPRDPLQRQL